MGHHQPTTPELLRMKECSVKKVLRVKVSQNDPPLASPFGIPNVQLNFSTFSDSKVAKYQGKICQKFGEWGLFDKMSNLSHFRRQISNLVIFGENKVTSEIGLNDQNCLLKCDKIDIFSKSTHSPNCSCSTHKFLARIKSWGCFGILKFSALKCI